MCGASNEFYCEKKKTREFLSRELFRVNKILTVSTHTDSDIWQCLYSRRLHTLLYVINQSINQSITVRCLISSRATSQLNS